MFRAGLYAAGGSCGRLIGILSGGAPFGIPLGPRGLEDERCGLSEESRPEKSLATGIAKGSLCSEERFDERESGREDGLAAPPPDLNPANRAAKLSESLLPPAGAFDKARPCNFSGFGLGVGRTLCPRPSGVPGLPFPLTGADSVLTWPPTELFLFAASGTVPHRSLLFLIISLIFINCSCMPSTRLRNFPICTFCSGWSI